MAAQPVGTTVLFENERVRVWEMVLAPGETCRPHRHAHDYLMLYTTPSVIRSTLDDGRLVRQHIDPGAVAFRAVGASGLDLHAITNVGIAPSHHFIVEMLGPSAVDSARPTEHNGRGRTELVPSEG